METDPNNKNFLDARIRGDWTMTAEGVQGITIDHHTGWMMAEEIPGETGTLWVGK